MSRAHDYHPALPDFDPAQVLVDGCAVCEERSRNLEQWLAHADDEHFRRAVWRSIIAERVGLADASACERRIFRSLYQIVSKAGVIATTLDAMQPRSKENDR